MSAVIWTAFTSGLLLGALLAFGPACAVAAYVARSTRPID